MITTSPYYNYKRNIDCQTYNGRKLRIEEKELKNDSKLQNLGKNVNIFFVA